MMAYGNDIYSYRIGVLYYQICIDDAMLINCRIKQIEFNESMDSQHQRTPFSNQKAVNTQYACKPHQAKKD